MKKNFRTFREGFKLSFNPNPKYYVNTEKKKVTCILSATFLVPGFTAGDYKAILPNMFSLDIQAKGVAKCSENDDFDVNRGMHIALAKAEMKAYRAAKEYLNECAGTVMAMAKMANEFITKADYFLKHNEEHVEVLSDKNNPNYNKELKPIHAIVTTKVKK